MAEVGEEGQPKTEQSTAAESEENPTKEPSSPPPASPVTTEGEEEKSDQKPLAPAAAATPAPPVSSFASLSLSIWPPSQRTRDAVLGRLVETLSSTSVLSQRYGTVPPDEASGVARQIEEEAFSVANAAFGDGAGAEDDGMEILQIYSRDISKRMLEAVKARATAAAPSSTSSPAPSSASPAEASQPESAASAVAHAASEEISSVASESSQA